MTDELQTKIRALSVSIVAHLKPLQADPRHVFEALGRLLVGSAHALRVPKHRLLRYVGDTYDAMREQTKEIQTETNDDG